MSRALHATLLAVAITAAAAPRAVAQVAYRLTLDPGTRVRVVSDAQPDRRVVGTVLALSGDTLRIDPRGEATYAAIPVGALRRLEVQGGEDRRRGMAIGGGIATAITLVFGGVDRAHGRISSEDLVGTTLTNALVGILLGYAFAPRGWEPLPLPR